MNDTGWERRNKGLVGRRMENSRTEKTDDGLKFRIRLGLKECGGNGEKLR